MKKHNNLKYRFMTIGGVVFVILLFTAIGFCIEAYL